MGRTAREKSASGLYHVMLRGIGKQILFEESEDYDRFLDTLARFKEEQSTRIHAYCLMENHVHLLIKVENDPLEVIFKRICGRYVYWYNVKYERIGKGIIEKYLKD